MLLLLALSSVEGLALLQDVETTDTFRSWRPQPGHRAQIKAEAVENNWIKFSKGEAARPVKSEKARSFDGLQEVLETEGRLITKARVTFSKATHRKNLWEKPFSFQGAPLVLTDGLDIPRSFAREDGRPFGPDESTTLQETFSDNRSDADGDGTGEPGDNPFQPRNALKAGQSVELPAKAVARLLGGEKAEDYFDLRKSAATLTFKSAATRAGARYATLVVAGIYPMKRYRDIELVEPLTASLTLVVDLCIDGSRPDTQVSYVFEIKGASAGSAGGFTGQVEIEDRVERKFSLRTITEE